MSNYSGATITRLVYGGRRVGALVQMPGCPDMILSEQGLYELGAHLKRTGQRLGNAKITADGRIVPHNNNTVRDDDGMKYAKQLASRRYKPQLSRPMSSPSVSQGYTSQAPNYVQPSNSGSQSPYRPSSELYHTFNVPEGPTEDRLLSAIVSGLELAKTKHSIQYQINHVKQNPDRRSRRRYYLRVDVTSSNLAHKYRELYFSAYPDGTIEADGQWKDADVLSYAHQGDKIYCQTAIDVCNAMIWFLHKSGWSSEYNKNKAEIEKLAAESNGREKNVGKTLSQELVVRHSPVDVGFNEAVRDFEQIKQYLNRKFAGTYAFKWAVRGDKAVLHACKYTSDLSAISDPLLSMAFQLYPLSGGRAVRMSYKSKASYSTQGSGRWVNLREFQCIKYLDGIGDAAESVLASVFSPGAFREAYDVVAYGVENGSTHYLVRGGVEPITEQALLSLAEGGSIVNGVCFEVGQDGKLAVICKGVDRYGHDLARYAVKDGRRYMRITYTFTDTTSDAETQIKAAVPWDLYCNLTTSTRIVSEALQHPSQYVHDMLPNVQIQASILNSVGVALRNVAAQRGYGDSQKAQLILDFMKCCWFVSLADITHGNRTPVETFVDKAGCCIEQSLLAAILTTYMGLNSCVLYRYSPSLSTRFHAVVGVRLNSFDKSDSIEFCGVESDKYTYVEVGGFFGLEVSGVGSIPIGAVKYWDEKGNGATGVAGVFDASKLSQVICVPFYANYTCGKAFAQYRSDRTPNAVLAPMTREQWDEVIRWFS